MRYYVHAQTAVPAGKHQVRMEFAYGGGLAKCGLLSLYIDGFKVGEGRVEATVPMIYSGDESCDLGNDTGPPVSEDYTSVTSHFNGKINWVQLDAGVDDFDHLISPEERLRVATAIQSPPASVRATAPHVARKWPSPKGGPLDSKFWWTDADRAR